MGRVCGSCGGGSRRPQRATSGTAGPSITRQQSAQAGAGGEYEVLTAAGRSTGRKFTSLVAASAYATRINGSTRPVT